MDTCPAWHHEPEICLQVADMAIDLVRVRVRVRVRVTLTLTLTLELGLGKP